MRLDGAGKDRPATRLQDYSAVYRKRWEPGIPPPGPICLLSQRNWPVVAPLGWGQMWSSDRLPEIRRDLPWGFDNGAWVAFKEGQESFPTNRFIRRVGEARRVQIEGEYSPPIVAVVPDKVQAGMESLEFSLDWLSSCRDLAPGWPWYLAIQGGMTVEGVEEVLDRFDGVFMGGAHEEKSAARLWARVAHDHGLPFHYGGAGTKSKLTHAFEVGADSLDSLSPVRRRRDWERFLRRFDLLARQHPHYRRRVATN